MFAALVLPLSSEAVVGLPMRPALTALVVGAGLLFVTAAGFRGSLAVLPGFVGVLCGAMTTLALLRDPGIAGSAAIWVLVMVLAVWLSAALCVVQLASMRPRNKVSRRALSLAVPLLFGAVVFYLWEVLVRGFGVSPVIMPAPSARRRDFSRQLPTLGEDFVQTFIRGVLIGYAIGCGAGLLVAIVAQRFALSRARPASARQLLCRHCRWWASHLSW